MHFRTEAVLHGDCMKCVRGTKYLIMIPAKLHVSDLPEPKRKETEVKIRSLICGSEERRER